CLQSLCLSERCTWVVGDTAPLGHSKSTRRACNTSGIMSSHWREPVDPSRHKDWFHAVGGTPRQAAKDPLGPQWSYFVRVPGFVFEFASIDQIAAALEWFSRDIPRSSADGFFTNGHEHWPRWFERLPAGLARGKRRPVVRAALEAALREFGM